MMQKFTIYKSIYLSLMSLVVLSCQNTRHQTDIQEIWHKASDVSIRGQWVVSNNGHLISLGEDAHKNPVFLVLSLSPSPKIKTIEHDRSFIIGSEARLSLHNSASIEVLSALNYHRYPEWQEDLKFHTNSNLYLIRPEKHPLKLIIYDSLIKLESIFFEPWEIQSDLLEKIHKRSTAIGFFDLIINADSSAYWFSNFGMGRGCCARQYPLITQIQDSFSGLKQIFWAGMDELAYMRLPYKQHWLCLNTDHLDVSEKGLKLISRDSYQPPILKADREQELIQLASRGVCRYFKFEQGGLHACLACEDYAQNSLEAKAILQGFPFEDDLAKPEQFLEIADTSSIYILFQHKTSSHEHYLYRLSQDSLYLVYSFSSEARTWLASKSLYGGFFALSSPETSECIVWRVKEGPPHYHLRVK